METEAAIRARITSVEQLLGIVRAIRSLAAARVQQAREGVESIRQYATVSANAVADVLAMLPEHSEMPPHPPQAACVFVLCSEHGFVGALNNRQLAFAKEIRDAEGATLMIAGSRGAAIAKETGIDVGWSTSMATHSGAVEAVSRRIAGEVYRQYRLTEGGRIDLVYPRVGRTFRHYPQRTTLLPFATARAAARRAAVPPMHNISADALFAAVVREHVFSEITLAVMETLASVNKARLAAMQSATDNLEDEARSLSMRERRVRQDEITTEMLDVVTGAEAVAHRSGQVDT